MTKFSRHQAQETYRNSFVVSFKTLFMTDSDQSTGTTSASLLLVVVSVLVGRGVDAASVWLRKELHLTVELHAQVG